MLNVLVIVTGMAIEKMKLQTKQRKHRLADTEKKKSYRARMTTHL